MKVPVGALAILGMIVSCSGSDGAAGPAGPAGPAGAAGGPGGTGSSGEAGAAGTTTVLVLSARAKAGLDASPVPVNIAGLSSDAVEKIGIGSYIVNAVADCNGCHQSTDNPPKFLAGGTKFDLGNGNFVYGRNITPGGPQITEKQFVEALQTGKDFGNANQVLLVMPWVNYRWANVSELKAVYAYLQAIPAVSNAVPAPNKGTLGTQPIVPLPTTYNEGDTDQYRPDIPPDGTLDPDNVLRGLAIQPLATPPGFGNAPGPAIPIADQKAFGAGSYLVNSFGACNHCHTNPSRKSFMAGNDYLKINTAQYLAGGMTFVVPTAVATTIHQTRNMSQNLTGTNFGYYDPYSAFLGIMNLGKHTLDTPQADVGWPMPWPTFQHMVSDDLEAIYTYITNVPRRTGNDDKEIPDGATWCASNNDCDTGAGETCNTATSECVGATCAVAGDCRACQTCTNSKCAAPANNATCLTQGM